MSESGIPLVQKKVYRLAPPSNVNESLGFPVNSIMVDNLTNQWLFFPTVDRWIPPYWIGAILRSHGAQLAQVEFRAPGGFSQAVPRGGEVATVSFVRSRFDPVDGESVPTRALPVDPD